MSQFSSALLLADLDYIAPSQVCIIKPVTSEAYEGDRTVSTASGNATVFIHNKGEELPAPQTKLETIKITLQDCLACSGCVTTAETMLVISQSRPEIEAMFPPRLRLVSGSTESTKDKIEGEGHAAEEIDDATLQSPKTFLTSASTPPPLVVSISEQSAASIAVQLTIRRRRQRKDADDISIYEAKEYISGFFKKHLGAKLVFDTEWAQIISTRETAKEYKRRLLLPSGMERGKKVLPMIIASCPGWVCYCEKTHPQLLPLLCPVMSPQGIAGSFVKHVFPECYHVSIQPCFDRKLESVREDFLIPSDVRKNGLSAVSSLSSHAKDGTNIDPNERMINCVLSTGELWEWMQDVEGVIEGLFLAPLDNVAKIFEVRSDALDCYCESDEKVMRDVRIEDEVRDVSYFYSSPPQQTMSGSLCDAELLTGSGGYHQHCLTSALRDLCFSFNSSLTPFFPFPFPWSDIIYQTKRNSNHRVISVKDCVDKSISIQEFIKQKETFESSCLVKKSTSLPVETLGEVCVAYGFQHIQNIVRSINRKMASVAKYTLIELMACPEGCLNGGGQVRGGVNGTDMTPTLSNAETLAAVQAVYMAGRSTSNTPPHKKLRKEGEEKSCEGIYTYRSLDDHPSFLATVWARSYVQFDNTSDNVIGESLRVDRPQDACAAKDLMLSSVRMTFHDRKADMDKMGNVVASLKW